MANKVKEALIKAAKEITSLTNEKSALSEKIASMEKDAKVKEIARLMIEKSLISEDNFNEKVAQLKEESDNRLDVLADMVNNIDENFSIGELSKEAGNNLSPEEKLLLDLRKGK